MGGEVDLDLGPEPLRVLSQTTVIRNGPTYLKLSTLRASTPLLIGQDAPTAKVEFLPRELSQKDGTSSLHASPIAISSSSSRTQSVTPNVSWSRRFSDGFRARSQGADEHHALAPISPYPTIGPRPREISGSAPPNLHQDPTPRSASPPPSRSNQRPGTSNSASPPSSGPAPGPSNLNKNPTSSNMPSKDANSVLKVHSLSKKVRRTDIETVWYYSVRANGLATPTSKAKDLKRGVEEGYLYLHHLTQENLQEPTIWIWQVKSDSDKGWVRIEKGHLYPYGKAGDPKRFLSISPQGQPSWNKKDLNAAADVVSD